MRVLVGCESSGAVREAFRAFGHDAWSCDLLPSEIPGNHIQDSVLNVLSDGWDLMIAHPPCTYLSYAATRYWNQPGRARKRLEALDFFLQLWESPVEKICLENPLGCVDAVIRKHDQIIHPYFFGDSNLKRTCLWLKNLPLLRFAMQDNMFETATATARPEPVYTDKSGRKRYFTDAISGYTADGWKKRSKTFPVIALAMAQQWTDA